MRLRLDIRHSLCLVIPYLSVRCRGGAAHGRPVTGVAMGGHTEEPQWTVNRSIDAFCFNGRPPETFRTPTSGPPAHIELQLDGFRLGIATVEAARGHGLRPSGDGRWIEIVLWTDDTDAAVSALTAKGAPLLSPAHDFLTAGFAQRGSPIRTATLSSWSSRRIRASSRGDPGIGAAERKRRDNNLDTYRRNKV